MLCEMQSVSSRISGRVGCVLYNSSNLNWPIRSHDVLNVIDVELEA